jgi:hypothetical protein
MGIIRSGLVIKEPWISKILRGEKTWEMRSKPTNKRERIALIRKGSGSIVGLATVTGTLGPLDERQIVATFHKHGVAPEDVGSWCHAWILENVLELVQPVRYVHKGGAVTWVTLDSDASLQVSACDWLAADAVPDG